MRQEIQTREELGMMLGDIVDSFTLNNKLSPFYPAKYLPNELKLKEVDVVDLFSLPINSLIYVHGQHNRASYWLLRLSEKDGQREVDIWRNLDSDGLHGGIDKMIAVDIQESDGKIKWIMDKGILRKGANMAFPYFDYEPNPNRPGEGSVCLPWTYWMHCYKKIELFEN